MSPLSPRGGVVRAGSGALLLLLALAIGGCDGQGAPMPQEREVAEARLADGAATLEDLGADVWGALVAGDTATLHRLRLSRDEHDHHLWPEQPAARTASTGGQLDFWWRNIETRNAAAVTELLGRFRGSAAVLEGSRCQPEPLRYRTYEALTGCRLLLRQPDGRRVEVEAFRHVVRMDGVHKVVRYYGG